MLVFEKRADKLLREIPLKKASRSQLRKLFNRPTDDPMYDSYPVTKTQTQALQPLISEPIDLKRYDYFVECYKPKA